MRRPQRLIAAAVLISFSAVLAGCSSSFGSDFDPTDLLDWLDTKKKLPGERKPVFPSGVPGMEQGVPKEMYKGAQQDDPNAQALAAPPPPQAQPQAQVAQQPLEPPPGSPQAVKRAKAKAKEQSKSQATAAAPAAAEPDGETAAASQDDGAQAAPAAPKKKIVRKRTTAPPPDQAAGQPATQSAQQSPSAFPAPLPGGTFSR
jgi:hypothetical protein